ncbi:beta-mannanase [Arthrobacter sp. RIT-PI-e]|nr:beta-mannanase [Arthrobacter sp. RIT-PI-e]
MLLAALPARLPALAAASGRGVVLVLALAVLLLGLTPPAQAAATISLSSSSAVAGSSITVTGAGFPKRTAATLVAGGTSVRLTTTSAGTFDSTLTVPAATTSISVTAGRSAASAPFTITQPAEEPVAQPPAASTPKALRFGAGTGGGPMAVDELDEVARPAGEAPSIVLSYKDFDQPAPIAELEAVRARGADALLAWEPWGWGGGTEQPAYSLARMAAGDFDAHLRQWGADLARWGQPVYLRFGHEMNGDWYPWAEGVNGNAPGSYVAAYRHVHDVVVSMGAGNVSWVWNPNVPYQGSIPLDGLYPGAAYADVVALDGYNWGTSQPWSTWQDPQALFGEGITELRRIAPGKPIAVAETASAESGGSKAGWIGDLVRYLSAQPDVAALIWFHLDKEADWRIDSSASSASALAPALAARR